MKREDLSNLGLTEDQVNQIMDWNGADIEKHKAAAVAFSGQLEAHKKQLAEANQAIEGFRALDVDGIKKAADEWKAKAEQAAREADEKIAKMRFNQSLEGALLKSKARNVKAVQALLNQDELKLTETGELLGLKEQLEKIKAENDFMFEPDQPTPEIVAGSSNPKISDAVITAARKAAGLTTE